MYLCHSRYLFKNRSRWGCICQTSNVLCTVNRWGIDKFWRRSSHFIWNLPGKIGTPKRCVISWKIKIFLSWNLSKSFFQAISARHPFYKMEARNWQNSIRHNLTLNKNFCKLPRLTTEGRGSHWKLEKGAERTIFKRGGRSNPPKVKESFSLIVQDSSNVVVDEEVVETVVDTSNPDQTILIMTIPQS